MKRPRHTSNHRFASFSSQSSRPRRIRRLPTQPHKNVVSNSNPRSQSPLTVIQSPRRSQSSPYKIYFDLLPDDAILPIIDRLALSSPTFVNTCPLLNLAAVSDNLRRLIATEIGSRLSLSVYGNPDWFFAWVSLAGPSLRTLSLHSGSYRSVGGIRHVWPVLPRTPVLNLDALQVFTSLQTQQPPLEQLDLSGLQTLRRPAIAALTSILTHSRFSLRLLKLDLVHFRISNAVTRAALYSLRKLVICNLDNTSEPEIIPLLLGLRPPSATPHTPLNLCELSFEDCDILPTVFSEHSTLLTPLLSNVQSMTVDFDDELCAYPAIFANGSSYIQSMCRPSLRTLVLSGSGVPITADLLKRIRIQCPHLDDLRLKDCDVEPLASNHLQSHDDFDETGFIDRRSKVFEAINLMADVLTHFYPRWLRFRVEQLGALATVCRKLSHLRIFLSPGAERWLSVIAERFGDSLIEIGVYPMRHLGISSMSQSIMHMILKLRRVEHVSLVTLELSATDLKAVLEHCGTRLKSFSFSPSMDSPLVTDEVGDDIVDIIEHAAKCTVNLRKLEIIFQHDWAPMVEHREMAQRIYEAVNLLESRCMHLEMSALRVLLDRMMHTSDFWPGQSRSSPLSARRVSSA